MAMDMISGRNGGYPCVGELPELSAIPDSKSPYPDMLMRCLGETVNGGYPVIMALGNVNRRALPNIYIGKKQIKKIYIGSKYITSVYYGNKKIY